MSNDYRVVWPRSKMMLAPKPMAPRLSSLDGKTIAFCWDYIFRGNEIWEFLKEEFSKRTGTSCLRLLPTHVRRRGVSLARIRCLPRVCSKCINMNSARGL